MRCAKCEHVWHQNPFEKIPEEEEPSEPAAFTDESSQIQEKLEEEIDAETPIPQSVIPDHKQDDTPETSDPVDTVDRVHEISLARGVGAGVFIVLVTVASIIGLRAHIVKSLPGMMPFYDLIGLHINLPGEDLVFDKIAVDLLPAPEANGNDTLVYQVTGDIINLGLYKSEVPNIRAQFWMGEEKIGKPQIFQVNIRHVAAEKTVSFSKILSMPDDLGVQPTELRLAFVMEDNINE